jgi:hypothetical protein
MPLQWTTIDLPWAGGIDAKRHPYLRELPKAETLVNLRFQQTGSLVARDGYVNLGGPAQDPDVAFRWGDVVVNTGASTWLLDQPGGNWRQLGFTGPRAVSVAQRPILRTQEGASTMACGVASGHVLHAWTRDDGPEVYVLVRSLETGVVVYGPTTVAGLDVDAPYGTSLRVAAHENIYVTVFASAGGASVNGVTFSITAAGAVTVGTAAAFSGTDADHYEVHANPTNSNVYLVTDNGANLRLLRLTRSGLALSVESACTLSSAGSLTSALGVCHNAVAGYVYAWSTDAGGGGGSVQQWRTSAAATLPASVGVFWTLAPGATDPTQQLAMRAAPRADGTTCLLIDGTTSASPYDLTDTPPGNIGPTSQPYGVWQIEVDDAGDETNVGTTWNVRLGAAPLEWQGSVHAVLLAPDNEQSETTQNTSDWPYGATAPVINFTWSRSWGSRRVAYVVSYGPTAGPRRVAEAGHDVVSKNVSLDASATIAQSYDATELVLPLMTVELPSEQGASVGPFSDPAYRSLREYRFAYRKHVATGEAGNVGLVASGYLAALDGDRLGEVMQVPPPTPVDVWNDANTAPTPTVVSGSTAAYVMCWEWRDAQGRLHRSAPSAVINNGLTNGTGDYDYGNVSFRVAIPPFLDAEVKAGCLPKDIYLVVYSSPALKPSGTVFNTDDTFWAEVPSYGYPLEDIREASYPWMSERISVTEASSTPLTRPLYTNGDVLENDPLVNPLHMATTRDRVWVIDCENRDTAWYSKALTSPEVAPEFSAALTQRVPTEAGELVALGSIDDLVLFFSSSSIFGLDTADTGPDSTGAGDWPPLRRISREIGCVNAASVVTTDVGCFFAAASGIHLVQATGQLVKVGTDLGETLDPSTITSAHVVPEREEVVFATSGALYVYDYEHQQWTTIAWTATDRPTAGGAVLRSSVAYGGETVVVASDGRAWQEDGASEELVFYQVRTGWIHLSGLQGAQRIRRFGVLGRITFDPTPSPPFEDTPAYGSLAIRVYYDYDDTDFDDYTIDLATVHTSGDIPELDPMRLRQRLARQKCEAIAFRVTVVPPTAGQGPIFSPRPELVGMALEVGGKRRLFPWAHALGSPAPTPE